MLRFPLGLGFEGVKGEKSPIINNLHAGICEKLGKKPISDPSGPQILIWRPSWNQIDEKVARGAFRAWHLRAFSFVV
jgi:hypothetical protein